MNLGTERQSIEAELVQKALTDDQFRQALIADPKAAIEKEWGVALPDELTITLHQETRTQLHVVLPFAPNVSDELSASELTADSASKWGHFIDCTLECTQCGNNDTSCQPGDTGDE